MNGIGGVVARNAEDDDARDVGDDHAGRRRLAELLLPALYASLAQLPQDPLLARMGNGDAGEHVAEGWRSGAIGLTQSAIPTSASAPPTALNEGVAGMDGVGERLTALVDGGELGAIRLVIERTQAGVAVQVAAADPTTAARAELERASLEQSLRAAGVSIASITVISEGGGTVLAQSSSSQRLNVLDTKGDTALEEEVPAKGRKNKRLNLTG